MATAKPDYRLITVMLTIVVIIVTGLVLQKIPDSSVKLPVRVDHSQPSPHSAYYAHEQQARRAEIQARFEQGAVMLHAKQFDHALIAFHRVLELAPDLTEAHVNMGYTLIGLNNFAAAQDFFQSAIELRPTQTNAYYGLALALEEQGYRKAALDAMRTYIHLSNDQDPFLPKARAALWEWEARMTGNPLSPGHPGESEPNTAIKPIPESDQ